MRSGCHMLQSGSPLKTSLPKVGWSAESRRHVQETGTVNLNMRGDDHVSFSGSHLALSPDGKYLLVSTDGPRILMLRVRGGPDHAAGLLCAVLCSHPRAGGKGHASSCCMCEMGPIMLQGCCALCCAVIQELGARAPHPHAACARWARSCCRAAVRCCVQSSKSWGQGPCILMLHVRGGPDHAQAAGLLCAVNR